MQNKQPIYTQGCEIGCFYIHLRNYVLCGYWNLWTNSCVAIDVRLQLSDGILRLVSTCDTMRIVVMHTYDKATATFVAKGDDVAKDAAATILRIGLAATIVGNVASFARLELNAVFGFSHLLELLYGEFIHYCCGQFLILYSPHISSARYLSLLQ